MFWSFASTLSCREHGAIEVKKCTINVKNHTGTLKGTQDKQREV